MDSKTSNADQLTSVETTTVVVPEVSRIQHDSGIPQEIIDKILDHLVADSGWTESYKKTLRESLRLCSLVSRSWVPWCRRYLFYTVLFTPRGVVKWLKTFPVPEKSPAHYVRDLRFSLGGYRGAPAEFFKHTPWFTKVEKTTVLGYKWFPSLGIPLSARLPQSATSLTIEANKIDLLQMRNVMMQLPNLDDLLLSGSPVDVARKPLQGLGTVLRGKFGGKFRLSLGSASEDFVNMLLEAPAGLHFTEVYIHTYYSGECLLQTVRLAEACRKTLTKISYARYFHYGLEPFERSFDFSESPNLQKVHFGLCWIYGDLRWISIALSTLKPTTSPRLSSISLYFSSTSSPRSLHHVSGTTKLEILGNDLRRVADELSRIEREYEGVVDLIVSRDAGFKRVDTRNVLQRWGR